MNYNQIHHLISDLPGAQRVAEGLNDHREHRHTPASCLVRMARPRLAMAGLMKALSKHDTQAELDPYPLLASESNQAYGRYNALIRELVSFERALDHRLGQKHSEVRAS